MSIFIGVVPATDFIKGSGVEMTDRGFLPVNKVSPQKWVKWFNLLKSLNHIASP